MCAARSGFVLRPEKQRRKEAEKDRSSNAAGRGAHPAGHHAEQPVLIDGLPDALCKIVPKAGQRDGRTGAAEADEKFIETHAAEQLLELDLTALRSRYLHSMICTTPQELMILWDDLYKAMQTDAEGL